MTPPRCCGYNPTRQWIAHIVWPESDITVNNNIHTTVNYGGGYDYGYGYGRCGLFKNPTQALVWGAAIGGAKTLLGCVFGTKDEEQVKPGDGDGELVNKNKASIDALFKDVMTDRKKAGFKGFTPNEIDNYQAVIDDILAQLDGVDDATDRKRLENIKKLLTPIGDGQPVVDQPVVGQPVVGQPVVSQPVVGQPVVSQPVVGQPVVGQPVVSQPVVGQPVDGQTVDGQTVDGKPVDGTGEFNPTDEANWAKPKLTQEQIDAIIGNAAADDNLDELLKIINTKGKGVNPDLKDAAIDKIREIEDKNILKLDNGTIAVSASMLNGLLKGQSSADITRYFNAVIDTSENIIDFGKNKAKGYSDSIINKVILTKENNCYKITVKLNDTDNTQLRYTATVNNNNDAVIFTSRQTPQQGKIGDQDYELRQDKARKENNLYLVQYRYNPGYDESDIKIQLKPQKEVKNKN